MINFCTGLPDLCHQLVHFCRQRGRMWMLSFIKPTKENPSLSEQAVSKATRYASTLEPTISKTYTSVARWGTVFLISQVLLPLLLWHERFTWHAEVHEPCHCGFHCPEWPCSTSRDTATKKLNLGLPLNVQITHEDFHCPWLVDYVDSLFPTGGTLPRHATPTCS